MFGRNRQVDDCDLRLAAIVEERRQALDLIRRCHERLILGYARQDKILDERSAASKAARN